VFLPALVTRPADALRLPRRRLVRLLDLRLAVPLRRRVRHAFLAAALRFALVIRPPLFRRAGDLRPLRLRVAAAFFAARLRFEALRLRVAAAFLAAALRFAAVDRPDLRFAEVFLRPALRLRVAAAFLAAVLRFAALRLRVAAAFLAAVLRLEEVEREALRFALVALFGVLRALRLRVAAAFLAAVLRLAAFLFLVAAAFFAAADLDALVPFFAAILFTFFGGLTRISFDSAMDGAIAVRDISGMSSNTFHCSLLHYNVFSPFRQSQKDKAHANTMTGANSKATSQTLTLRLSDSLLEKLRERAETENRTLSNLIRTYLEIAVTRSTDDVKSALKTKTRRRTKSKNGR
jgi:hypothetical protein